MTAVDGAALDTLSVVAGGAFVGAAFVGALPVDWPDVDGERPLVVAIAAWPAALVDSTAEDGDEPHAASTLVATNPPAAPAQLASSRRRVLDSLISVLRS